MTKITRDEIHNLICNNLKKLRLSMDASQMTFGSYAGISNRQYSKYESGKSRIHATHLFMIAEECNVDVVYFFK